MRNESPSSVHVPPLFLFFKGRVAVNLWRETPLANESVQAKHDPLQFTSISLSRGWGGGLELLDVTSEGVTIVRNKAELKRQEETKRG